MGFFGAIWHFANFLLPGLLLGGLAATLAKGAWRHELSGVRWARLAGRAGLASVMASVAGLVVQGRDGRMATYVAMVLACALALWWTGFGPARRTG